MVEKLITYRFENQFVYKKINDIKKWEQEND